MCGIVGFISTGHNKEQARELINRLVPVLRHRGPDGEGVFIDDYAALGHVRLSVIDPIGGHQPMTLRNGRYIITYNGEIYNFLELRKELLDKGHIFQTQSDTEVLLAGYVEWGTGILDKINGMFSFCLYDRNERELFCARDPYGQKPFYYTAVNSSFYFSSEARVFPIIPSFQKKIDPISIAQFLSFESLYFDQCIFEGVHKLPPGHFLLVKNGMISRKRFYFNVPTPQKISLPDAIEELDHQMKKAIQLAFRSDVPVGVLLSGGLDSSLIMAMLSSIGHTSKVMTFHVRTGGASYDESEYAQQVAKACGTDCFVFPLELKELASLALKIPQLFDEPQADPGILPKYFVCKKIAEHGKVALTGDGGDEFFFGYISFKAQKMSRYYRYFPGFLHRRFIYPLVNSLPSSQGYMRWDFLLKNFVKGFPSSEALRNHKWTRSFSEQELTNLLGGLPTKDLNLEKSLEYLNQLDNEALNSGYFGRFAYKYQHTYLPDYVLCNSDRASMLNSVELRTPFLDTQLVKFANSLEDKHKMSGFQLKHILKKLALRYLPPHLVFRKKMGFTVPMSELLLKDLKLELEDLFSEKRLKNQGFFHYPSVRNLLDRHFSQRFNLYKPIWTLYSLQKWLQGQGLC